MKHQGVFQGLQLAPGSVHGLPGSGSGAEAKQGGLPGDTEAVQAKAR